MRSESSFEFVPFVSAGPVCFGAPRDEVRRVIGVPRSDDTRFYWTETFGEPGEASWFVGYDEAGRVVHVDAADDPSVAIPDGVRVGILRRELWQIAGPPPIPTPATDFFFDDATQGGVKVQYDDDFRAIFVEVSRPFDAVWGGLRLLTTPADEIVKRIPGARTEESPGDELTEPIYPVLGLALWRSGLPEDDPDAPDNYFETAALAASADYWR